MAPFRYEDYVNPFVGSIGEMMQRGPQAQAQAAIAAANARARAAEIGGQAQARAAEQSGAAWGGAVQQIGQGISGAIQQANDPRLQLERQQLETSKRAQALNGTVNRLMSGAMTEQEDGSVTFDRAKLRQGFNASNVPLPLQEQTFKSLDEVDKSLQSFAQARVDHSADVAHSILTNPHGVTPETVAFGLALAKANGLASDKSIAPIIDAIAQGADPKAVLMQVRGLSEKYRKLAEPVKLSKDEILIDPNNPGGAPLASNMVDDPSKGAYTGPDGLRYNAKGVPITGEVMKPQTAATPKSYQKSSALVDGKPAEILLDPTPGGKVYDLNGQPIEDAATRVKPIPPASTQVNVGSESNVKEAVAGMIDGTIPPQMPGKASKEYTATLAEAHRQGYDLKKAVLDYAAVQKHVATLNGAKFTTLLSSVKTASESLDVIDSLAKKWDGGGFPILNKANLALAKGGAYGPGAASIATQLEGQITDVVSELGQVYMGGNSPTDHALKLAEKNLSASWDKQVLLDMTKLARTNLSIRRNSIVNSEPVFTNSKENVSPTTTPSGMIGVTAPNNKTYWFKSQAEADAFKAKAGIR